MMTVHTFAVRHIKEGLEQIKAELGSSAVILGTKRLSDGTLEISAKGERMEEEFTSSQLDAAAPAPMMEHPALTHTIQSLQQSIQGLVNQMQTLQSEVRHMRLSQELQAEAAPSASRFPAHEEAKLMEAKQDFKLGLEALQDSSENQGLLDGLFSLQRALNHRGVTQNNIEEIMAHVLAQSDSGASLFDLAMDHIASWIEVDAPLWSGGIGTKGPQIHAMIGPTGVGKTTLVAKVAAYAHWAKDKKVGIICGDDFRIGGRFQLETYARLIEVPMVTVKDLSQMRMALEGLSDCDMVFVDTNALTIQTGVTTHAKQLDAGALSCLRPEYDLKLHLVLSATATAKEQCRYANALSDLDVASLIFTKIDEASHTLGSLLSTARATRLPISVLSDGRAVPKDLLRPSPKQLAAWILRGYRSRSRVETSEYILEDQP